ncbi:diguanylate cyclase (GGDEF) domain-containing protein [Granulicella rosea]|uniref:diguanylate cyclase n=1 Tax=Granulicella rosea TaxID=474952 RepID=A0A239KUN0_9BACT|nr:GGDEF domain-containing protein [Granulicella rosea]SNT21368.1 diguanylate cyclase (GGDEF) domain-containing protein [Granulicella rosea]
MALSSIESGELVAKEVARLESGTFRWLRLPAGLEQRYEEVTAPVRARRMWLEGLFCVLIYNSFLLCDFLLFPREFFHFFIVRVCLATPLGLLVVWKVKSSPSRQVRESLILFACAICAVSTLYLYSNINAVSSAFAVTDLLLIMLFTNAGIRLKLLYATASTAMCVTLGIGYVGVDRWLSGPQKVESLTILLAGAVLSLITNYGVERGERLNFLLRLRSEMQSEELAEANHHLRQISNEDRLTRLSNRRHFEEVYRLVWDQAVLRSTCVSVLMIDIDNFKLLNDTYGHAYGDAVLRRVATLLGESLRVRGDFVARYGGEEFVVVLPSCSVEAATMVAERIRKLVEIAGSPATDPDPNIKHAWSTVSCGVATGWPRNGVEREELIRLADSALYQAKAEGRNRVCVAGEVLASATFAPGSL